MANQENTRESRLKYAFGAHLSVQIFFMTSDDQMFVQKCDAQNHASTLEDKDILEAHRKDYVTSSVKPAPANQLDLEREALVAKHVQLFGKEPAKNAGIETLQKKIDAEESRLADETKKAEELAKQSAEGNASADQGSEEEE